MRILHTSDWHIGKRLMGRERLDEQIAVLGEIADICERERVELVLVAGDIFDTYLPSAEAENVFFEAVKKIAGSKRCVLAISGNHDDSVRLTASAALSEEQGIYLYGNAGRVPALQDARAVHPVQADNCHIVFANRAGESVYVNVLPYPNEARLKEDKDPDETFENKMRRWIARGEAAKPQGMPSVFLSHLFVAGGSVSEGEREIDLGGARAVSLDWLPACDYVALGHLHKRQHFRGKVYYSGSVLPYAFDEAGAQKSVVVFDLDTDGVHGLREIPLTCGKALVRLAETSVPAAIELLRKYENAYIELTLYLREPLPASQVRELREANAGLVSLLPVVRGDDLRAAEISRRRMSSSELFEAYYRSVYGEKPSEALAALFLAMTEDGNETETAGI